MWKNEAEAREQIKAMVAEYYHDFKEKKTPYQEGDRITYAARVFDEKEMCALTDATLDFWLTTGRFADRFEKEFAKWIGVKFAHLVNSGSSANLIAFMALTAPELGDRQIRKGDEIITVACGFPTSVTPAIQYGAVPVFVDVTVPQYNIDVTKLEAALSPKTKAVMIAHTLCNLFDLSLVARRWQAFDFDAETKVRFDPKNYMQMAGLTNYYDDLCWSWAFVTWDEKRHARVIEVAQNDFNQYTSFLKDDAIVVPEDAEAVWLRTKVRTEYYSYEYSFDGERFTEIPVKLDAKILSDDYVNQRYGGFFTGAFVGLACVDLSGYDAKAEFDYFDYRELPDNR